VKVKIVLKRKFNIASGICDNE